MGSDDADKNEIRHSDGILRLSAGRKVIFVLFFGALIGAAFAAGYYLPDSFDDCFRAFSTQGALSLARLLGLEALLESETLVCIEGTRLSIVGECTATNYLLIYAAAVLAWPAAGLKKLTGLLVGIPLIIFINLLRIVFLGWVGGNIPDWFEFFHLYLWEGGFALAVVLVWIAWLNIRSDRIGGFIKGFLLYRILLLAVCLASMAFFSDGFQGLLATVSERIIPLLGFEGVSVRSKGLRLILIFSRSNFREVWAGIYYLLPFVILMTLFPRIPRGEAPPGIFRVTAELALGILVLALLQLCFVVVYFFIVARGGESWQMVLTDTTARLAPVALWAVLAFRRKALPPATGG